MWENRICIMVLCHNIFYFIALIQVWFLVMQIRPDEIHVFTPLYC